MCSREGCASEDALPIASLNLLNKLIWQGLNRRGPNTPTHLAGQVAMTTSIENPRLDFEVNVGGTFNLLNAVRVFHP